jgi:lipid-A-disaccharide synthase
VLICTAAAKVQRFAAADFLGRERLARMRADRREEIFRLRRRERQDFFSRFALMASGTFALRSLFTDVQLQFSFVGNEGLRLMFVAGEASGDAHAAALARELNALAEERGAQIEFFGLTGALMRAAGVETIVRADELAITGLLEVGRALPKFWRVFKSLRDEAARRKPDAVILVDFPEFNLPLATSLHKRGLKIIYYISPQLWAWRAYRVRRIRRDVDLLLTILPFEKEWYAQRGFHKIEYVGHPLAGEVKPNLSRAEICAKYKLDPSHPVIALLPGSRRREIALNLPPMLDAAARILDLKPEAQFILALAAHRSMDEIKARLEEAARRAPESTSALRVAPNETRAILAAADAAAVASGTATLEAALTNTPLVVVYKETFTNWHTLGRLIHVEHYGLVNLIAEKRIAPELMQNDFTGETLARELLALLEPERNARARRGLREAAAKLGAGGASRRAADAIWRFLRADEKKQ